MGPMTLPGDMGIGMGRVWLGRVPLVGRGSLARNRVNVGPGEKVPDRIGQGIVLPSKESAKPLDTGLSLVPVLGIAASVGAAIYLVFLR